LPPLSALPPHQQKQAIRIGAGDAAAEAAGDIAGIGTINGSGIGRPSGPGITTKVDCERRMLEAPLVGASFTRVVSDATAFLAGNGYWGVDAIGRGKLSARCAIRSELRALKDKAGKGGDDTSAVG
jgi:hypothetical protein